MSESVKRPGTGQNLTVAIGAAVGAAAGATPALAEDQRLEEIIVTAKKRDMISRTRRLPSQRSRTSRLRCIDSRISKTMQVRFLGSRLVIVSLEPSL